MNLWLNRVLGGTVLATLFLYLPMVLLTPTVAWYNPGEPIFSDTIVGTSPALSFYREIKRNSLIEYSVVVRDERGEVACDARGGPLEYKKQEGFVMGKTLATWAPQDPRCANLPVGGYWVETTWTVVRPLGDLLPKGFLQDVFGGILPPKYVSRVSPVFYVRPKGVNE